MSTLCMRPKEVDLADVQTSASGIGLLRPGER